jgi:2-C-methyl-D-erythritol 2,4-cyclodiphosphate synthase
MFRVGNGYDVHRLIEGRKLILGGVDIPHALGLDGHSDADALCHALCDALLGACNAGDLGAHFPDTDGKWEGFSSLSFLEKVGEVVKESGYRVVNTDATIVAQKPKLAPHIEAMKRNIARSLGIEATQVSIKATTTETLGFSGREEGIAAYAIVLLQVSE